LRGGKKIKPFSTATNKRRNSLNVVCVGGGQKQGGHADGLLTEKLNAGGGGNKKAVTGQGQRKDSGEGLDPKLKALAYGRIGREIGGGKKKVGAAVRSKKWKTKGGLVQ